MFLSFTSENIQEFKWHLNSQDTEATLSSYTFGSGGGGEEHTQRTPTVLCPPSISVVQNRSLPQRLENQPHPFSRRKRLNTKAWASEHKQRGVMSHHVTLIWIEPHCWLNRVQTPWVDIPPSRLYSLYSHRYIRSSKIGNSLLKWALSLPELLLPPYSNQPISAYWNLTHPLRSLWANVTFPWSLPWFL